MGTMSFRDFATSKGLQLLRDDIKFLRKIIQIMPKENRKLFLLDYCQEWLSGINEEPNVQLKQNMGRRRANLWALHQRGKNDY